MQNLQANSQAPEGRPCNLEERRRPRRSLAVQIRLAPQELATIQRAAARWAAARTAKPAAPSPRRRYTAVPRYIRAHVLAAVAAEAPVGEELLAELEAFRREINRVGSLLNQSLRHAHSGLGTGPLVGAIETVGQSVAEIGEAVEKIVEAVEKRG